ncbi:MAG TPA: thiamine pyrophosphate-dependent enzyme, partial [Terriglobia bacterium]|nr:thiamine pyrophosphate-dependent enzyme [Terriglobia bacterium]
MIEKWRARDPILNYEKLLTRKKLMTADEKAAIESRLQEIIRADVEFAESSPLPAPEAAARPVWV